MAQSQTGFVASGVFFTGSMVQLFPESGEASLDLGATVRITTPRGTIEHIAPIQQPSDAPDIQMVLSATAHSGFQIIQAESNTIEFQLTYTGFITMGEDQPMNLRIFQSDEHFYQVDTQDEEIGSGSDEEKWIGFENEIRSFAEFRSKWGEEGNATPNSITIEVALKILDILCRWDRVPDGIYRTAEGGITFNFYGTQKYYIIEVFSDGDIVLSIDADASNEYQEIQLENINDFCLLLA